MFRFMLYRDGTNDVGTAQVTDIGTSSPLDDKPKEGDTDGEKTPTGSKHNIDSDLEFESKLGGKYHSLSAAHKGIAEMESTTAKLVSQNKKLSGILDGLLSRAEKDPEGLLKALKDGLNEDKGPGLKFGLNELGWQEGTAEELEKKLVDSLGGHLTERDKRIMDAMRSEFNGKFGRLLEKADNDAILDLVPIAGDDRFKEEISKVKSMIANGELTPGQQVALIAAGLNNKLVAEIGKDSAEKNTRQRAKDGGLPDAGHETKPASDSKEERIKKAQKAFADAAKGFSL
jgi:hypothetical protein